jgi:hypothetical protein|tara:strand:+ start:5511 stop:5903 length:393 start_codon:yes stop_codon:yes gene_type:complete
MMNDIKSCPTCRRPFRQLLKAERARAGHREGLEHQSAKSLKDAGKKCKEVYDYLLYIKKIADGRSHRVSDTNSWVCGEDLRYTLGKGDWQRRIRQLSEEFGVPIERKMDNLNGGAKVAYYRLGEDYETNN